jgi:outer membrane protein assembly factor BamB
MQSFFQRAGGGRIPKTEYRISSFEFRVSASLMALVIALAPVSPMAASDPGTGSWPMWGGTADRNMVSNMKGLPASWDVKTKKNIKWVAELGSQTYGNPVVAEGMVFVGTNNEGNRDPKIKGDKGILIAFRESDGAFLWQIASDKLQAGRVNDWPYQGICSSPAVENGVLYYVTNRSEVVAVNIRAKDKDGRPIPEILWKFDMIEELGNHPHNMSNSSPVLWGDLVFVSSSNGQDESHVNNPSPKAPAILALNKKTGKLVWEDASPGERILHGQWSTPAVGEIGGVMQVVSAQGDGWVRGYEAAAGKKLWEFDTNPKDSVWPKTRNELISTPVIIGNVVYIANGQDPEHGEGVGHMYAIDATKRGDITESGRLWHYTDIRRSISTPSIKDGVLYMADFSGFLHAVDAQTGKQIWKHDMLSAMWGSTMVADGKIYLGDEDGDVVVFAAGREKKVLAEMNMDSSVYSTVIPANGVLYLATRSKLYAIANLPGN